MSEKTGIELTYGHHAQTCLLTMQCPQSCILQHCRRCVSSSSVIFLAVVASQFSSKRSRASILLSRADWEVGSQCSARWLCAFNTQVWVLGISYASFFINRERGLRSGMYSARGGLPFRVMTCRAELGNAAPMVLNGCTPPDSCCPFTRTSPSRRTREQSIIRAKRRLAAKVARSLLEVSQ